MKKSITKIVITIIILIAIIHFTGIFSSTQAWVVCKNNIFARDEFEVLKVEKFNIQTAEIVEIFKSNGVLEIAIKISESDQLMMNKDYLDAWSMSHFSAIELVRNSPDFFVAGVYSPYFIIIAEKKWYHIIPFLEKRESLRHKKFFEKSLLKNLNAR